jgi:methylated-DNA-[protein]-cysteine S-methyltransferase
VGLLTVHATSRGLCGITFDDATSTLAPPGPDSPPSSSILRETLSWLTHYFKRGAAPGDLPPLDLHGTEFERELWRKLARLPPRTLITYGELAAQAGHRGAFRATGRAVGKNPIAILIPCHRVIGADHSLTGYAGGLPRKIFLLTHEGFHVEGTSRHSIVR